MSRFKTFTDGGTLLPSDVDSIEDDYEVAFSAYKTLKTDCSVFTAAGAGTFPLTGGDVAAGGSESSLLGAIWLDPAQYWTIAPTATVNPRSVYYNLGVAAQTNGTAVGTVTFTVGLYALTSAGVLASTPITGSTVTISDPAASTVVAGAWSGDFAAPSAGLYALAVETSAASAANAEIGFSSTLQMRQK